MSRFGRLLWAHGLATHIREAGPHGLFFAARGMAPLSAPPGEKAARRIALQPRLPSRIAAWKGRGRCCPVRRACGDCPCPHRSGAMCLDPAAAQAVRKYWSECGSCTRPALPVPGADFRFFGDISPLHAAAWQYVRLIPTNVRLWLKVPYAVMRARQRRAACSPIGLTRHSSKVASITAAERVKQLRWS